MLIWACPSDLRAALDNGLTAVELFAWNQTDGTDAGACPRCPECGEPLVVAEL